jgi:rare lipoprotein A
LPFGTVVKVTNLENQQSVEVTVNDRGHLLARLIDLSKQRYKTKFTAKNVRVKVKWSASPTINKK